MTTGSRDKKISVVPQVQRPEDVKSSNFLLRLLSQSYFIRVKNITAF